MAGLDSLTSNLERDKHDEFPLGVKRSKAPQKSLNKPVYFPDQISLAESILDRIKLILQERHEPKKSLNDFDKFDYQVSSYLR